MTTLAEKVQLVIDYSGVDKTTAETTLLKCKEDVISTLVELSIPPTISGTKHIPSPPVVDDGHDAETKERIIRGRMLADILSVSPKNDLRGKAAHYPDRQASASPLLKEEAVVPEIVVPQSK